MKCLFVTCVIKSLARISKTRLKHTFVVHADKSTHDNNKFALLSFANKVLLNEFQKVKSIKVA